MGIQVLEHSRAGVAVGDTVERLRSLIDRLGGVDEMTERAFLEIGAQVREGRQQSIDLAGQAESPLRGEGEESSEQSVARLQLLTERAFLWLTEARTQSESICSLLEGLKRDAEGLSVPLRGLGKVVKTLQALRVATRIEAARRHGQGAQVLGQELYTLAGSVQDKLGLIVERCEMLATLCQRAADLEYRAQSGSLREADVEIRQARVVLGKVAAQCVQSTDHSIVIQQRTAGLAENFGELVAALQFQDITRQRLQHVQEALRDVAGAMVDAPEEPHAVGEVCMLQYDQLRWAVDEFTDAIARLDDNLRGMANGVQALADDACGHLFAGGNDQCSRIAPALQAVTFCLEKVQTANLAAGQAVFAVCQAVRDVAMLSAEVEHLGEEMQLLAQNAAVSAAHGQVHAAGLTVIAGNIQALAEEAGRYAVAMAECCRKVSDRAGALDDAGEMQSGGGSANLDALLDEARGLIGRLMVVGQDFDAHINAISEQASGLAAKMGIALAGLDVRRPFLALLEPIIEQLAALAGEYGVSVHDESKRRGLDRIHSHYTMKSERDVHQRFLQEQGHEGEASTALPGSLVLDSLGSNVELF